MKIPKKSSENRLLSPRCAVGWEIVSWNVKIVSVVGCGVRLMRSVAWCAGKKTACHGGCPWHAVWGGLQVWRACRRLTFCQCSAYTWYGPQVLFFTVGDWEAGCFFVNDNTDNIDNRKNGRNGWMSRSDMQHRQRKLAVGGWEAGCVFFNDNADNRNNRKNGRNGGCHKVTYNTDNGITSATEKSCYCCYCCRKKRWFSADIARGCMDWQKPE